MVLDMDRQPLLTGIEARPLRDRPALQNAIEFEPEIVVQPPRGVLLHDKGERRGNGFRTYLPRRLRRSVEVAFAVVFFERHRGKTGRLALESWSRPPLYNHPANGRAQRSPVTLERPAVIRRGGPSRRGSPLRQRGRE